MRSGVLCFWCCFWGAWWLFVGGVFVFWRVSGVLFCWGGGFWGCFFVW